MIPSLIFQKIANDSALNALGISSNTVFESQSLDERPVGNSHFVTVSFEEMLVSSPTALSRGPRTVTIAVHRNWDDTRDYQNIDKILNRIDRLLLQIENEIGNDGVRITSVQRRSRSANMTDEGWRTITRTSTYGVLYDEYAA
jgi:hypothetical protein